MFFKFIILILFSFLFTFNGHYSACISNSTLKNYVCCSESLVLKLNEIEECCGSSLYDPLVEVCCNQVINVKFKNEKCCGTSTYDPNEHLCCQGKKHTKFSTDSCCGTEIFTKNHFQVYTKKINLKRPKVNRFF